VNNIIYLVGLVVVVAFIASFVLGHVWIHRRTKPARPSS